MSKKNSNAKEDREYGYSQLSKAVELIKASDPENAIPCLISSAESGIPEAQRLLGVFRKRGRYVEKDEAEAFRLFKLAYDSGDKDAACELADCYIYGIGTETDESKAVELYTESAEAGVTKACQALGSIYALRDDFQKAEEWYKKAIDGGDADAMVLLGGLYLDENYFKNKAEKGIELLTKAAELEKGDAQFILGSLYLSGEFFEKDEKKAVEYLKKAAENGNSEARLFLEKM